MNTRTAPPPRRSAPAPTSSSIRTGDAARAAMAAEQVRAAAQAEERKNRIYEPNRFFMKYGEPDGVQLIILDDGPDFVRQEHMTWDERTKRFSKSMGCIKDTGDCQGCKELEKQSYLGLFLSVIDEREYENRDKQIIPWSKKLMVIKPMQQKKINRLFTQHGSLRGMIITCFRDNEKDAAVGGEFQFDGWVEEEELAGFEREWTDKDKKVHVENAEPFDYPTIFPDPTPEQQAAQLGIEYVPRLGSRDAGGPAGRRSAAAPARRGAESPTRRGQAADEEEDAPAVPQRASGSARRGSAPEAAASRPARRAAQDDVGDEPDGTNDIPGADGQPVAAPTRTRRVAAPVEPEDEPVVAPRAPARRVRGAAPAPAPAPAEEPEYEGEAALQAEEPPFDADPPAAAPARRAAPAPVRRNVAPARPAAPAAAPAGAQRRQAMRRGG